MTEEFNRLLPLVKEKIIGVIVLLENGEINPLMEACAFCDFALGPDHPPYDMGGALCMLEIGRAIEKIVPSTQGQMRETLEEIIGIWKKAIVNFPMARRFAPAVEWAIEGISPIKMAVVELKF
jgi:hypothetical protein